MDIKSFNFTKEADKLLKSHVEKEKTAYVIEQKVNSIRDGNYSTYV